MLNNGVRNEVIVDDHIVSKWGAPVYSRAHGPELWVLLLEKAWAKIHGSFRRIEGGEAHLTMRDVTGAPGYSYTIDKTNYLAEKLVDWDQMGYMLAVGLDDTKAGADKLEALGLIPEHAYGIIAARPITDGAGNQITLA